MDEKPQIIQVVEAAQKLSDYDELRSRADSRRYLDEVDFGYFVAMVRSRNAARFIGVHRTAYCMRL